MSSARIDTGHKLDTIDHSPVDEENIMQASDIETQLQKLRSDISGLAKTVAAAGADTAGAYRAKAGNVANDAIEASQSVLEGIRNDFVALEKDVVARVQTRPLQALGLAAGIGFLLALASRR
ncbi:DUF883 C-terminal domain-containing protein [Telmatospirillum sp.]|uniref:DUF883 family protein n=1 Tax=Telmatospirillum sp. TaxID=2079197 RepID=UPI002845088D|nr:DUF883 C-terminal domain-containing protein [Telmatospirillum sp.]MDR3436196.1 DUF883 C-terminal domain-containing protein [Telmatospirillum sp.]